MDPPAPKTGNRSRGPARGRCAAPRWPSAVQRQACPRPVRGPALAVGRPAAGLAAAGSRLRAGRVPSRGRPADSRSAAVELPDPSPTLYPHYSF